MLDQTEVILHASAIAECTVQLQACSQSDMKGLLPLQMCSLPDTAVSCAGDQFALSEAVVALAMLMRRFEFSLDPEAPPVTMTTVCHIALLSSLVSLMCLLLALLWMHQCMHTMCK